MIMFQGCVNITIDHLAGENNQATVGDRIPAGVRNLDGKMIVC